MSLSPSPLLFLCLFPSPFPCLLPMCLSSISFRPLLSVSFPLSLLCYMSFLLSFPSPHPSVSHFPFPLTPLISFLYPPPSSSLSLSYAFTSPCPLLTLPPPSSFSYLRFVLRLSSRKSFPKVVFLYRQSCRPGFWFNLNPLYAPISPTLPAPTTPGGGRVGKGMKGGTGEGPRC